MSNPTSSPAQPFRIITERQLLDALSALTQRGTLALLTTHSDLYNVAQKSWDSGATGLSTAAHQLLNLLEEVGPNADSESDVLIPLRLTGMRTSGLPFFSLASAEPAPQPQEPLAEPTPQPEEDWEPEPVPQTPAEPPQHRNPRYPAFRLRSQLSELDRDTRIDLLTSLLADELLEYAADASDNPVEFTRLVSSITDEQANTLAFKTGASE